MPKNYQDKQWGVLHMNKTSVNRSSWWHGHLLGFLALLALLVPMLPLQAGGKGDEKTDPSKLTLDRIFSSADFSGESYGPIQWLEKQSGYTTREKADKEKPNKEKPDKEKGEKGKGEKAKSGQNIVRHDPETGKQEVLVSAAHLIPPGKTSPLNIENYHWSANEGMLLIFTNSKRVWRHNDRGDYWVYDVTTQKMHKLGGDAKASTLQFATFSPDGKKVAYVRENNIYVEDLMTRKITQLTKQDNPNIINGTFDWVYEEELSLRKGFRWSPNSDLIAYWQLDTSGVKDYHLVNNTAQLYPKITTFKYPKVGEVNSSCRVGVVAIDGKSPTHWLKVPGDPRDHYIARMTWAPKLEKSDTQTVVLQQLNRLQNSNKVMAVDVVPSLSLIEQKKDTPQKTIVVSEPRILLTETDKAWVDVEDAMIWFNHGKQFTWLSERDGWNHIYVVSRDGKDQKLITPGKYDVLDILQVDDDGWVWYYASPDNAAQKYLFRARVDGSKQEKITPDEFKGTNSYNLSPDAKWAIHTHSSFDSPPVIRLVRLPEHKEVRTLAANKKLHDTVSKLKRTPTEFFRVDIGDGLELDGWCIKPPDFDASKKYPLFFYVYGEPAAQTVLDSWGATRYLWHLMLAQQGYVVVSVDNRGTPAPRGRDFRKYIYRQMGIVAPKDQAAAAKAILKKWSWLDPNRVGVWGWSGGGTMSLHLIFRYPELYHMAMSVAPVSNERFYDTIYSERYMGLPSDNVKGYKDSSAITYAPQLKGKLLMVHGTGDDNVHYANTEAVINELIAHNKQFSMMAYPNRSHSIIEGKNTRRHLFGLLTNYLHQNLPAVGKSEK